MSNTKKIAFFGTPPFTTRFLESLYDEGFVPSLIVTNPDRPSGRGMKLTPPEPKVWGEAQGIPVLQPEKLDAAFYDQLNQEHWDLFIVVAYGKIIPENIISLPGLGTINVHYSLLPKYRGATPVESAILHGDTVTGVCIQQMRFKLDSGPILAQTEVSIDPTDTTVTLREKLNDEALHILPDAINDLFNGTAQPQEQDENQATSCRKIAKEDGEISLNDDPIELDRKFRAYVQSPGIFFMTKKHGAAVRVKVKAAHLEDGKFILDTVVPENGKPLTGSDFHHWLNS